MNVIGHIIDRDCHVGMSNKKVIRHVIGRLKNKEKTFWKLPKADRRMMIETCIREHKENRELYSDVMSGRAAR